MTTFAPNPIRRTAGVPAQTDMRLAAIDVGSNSIHLIVAQADADGSITTLWRVKEMVGLGRISFPSHRLSQEAMDRAILTLHRFVQMARRRQCEKVLAVATSAVREATNGGDFLERARVELGLSVRLVSARDEARLIYLGARHALPLKGGPHLIMDVGGGSVEFIVADEHKALLLESRKLGAARMTAKFIRSDPAAPRELAALRRHYHQELEPLCRSITNLHPIKAIGTSGTLENLTAMCGAVDKANGDAEPSIIEAGRFSRLLDKLLDSDASDRARLRGLDEKRQDQILAGAVLVGELIQRLNLERIHLCHSALREGILIDYLSRHLPDLAIRRQVPDPRRRSVLDLARRCEWNEIHSRHVAELVLQLFDQLKELHGMDPRARELIEYAAFVHDIGWHISPRRHHRHSMYLVLHGDLKGFTTEEVAIIANVARYHRKSAPAADHEEYQALSPSAKRMVQAGAALLRIGDGLDRSHCGAVTGLKCKIGKRRICVTLQGRGDMALEIWAAQRKMGLLNDIVGRAVTFKAPGSGR